MVAFVDVAKLAGVSTATVSRVLNGHPSVREETRQRVEAAMRSLNYRVTVAAEAPSHRQSSAEIVILLLESGDEPYRVLSWHNAFDGSAGKPL